MNQKYRVVIIMTLLFTLFLLSSCSNNENFPNNEVTSIETTDTETLETETSKSEATVNKSVAFDENTQITSNSTTVIEKSHNSTTNTNTEPLKSTTKDTSLTAKVITDSFVSDYTNIDQINTRGNSTQNIVNGMGIVSQQGDWIYYAKSIGKTNQICKMKVDGSLNSVIYTDRAYNINVIGDWILSWSSNIVTPLSNY